MRFTTLLPMLLAAGVAQAQFGQNNGQNKGQNGQNNGQNGQNGQNNGQNAQNGQNNGGNNAGNNAGGNAGGNLALNPANVQKNSQSNGLGNDAEAGQAASATDAANFINFCQGKTLTNGLQVKEGSCNGIVMGDIPATNKMVSAIFQNPKDGDDFTSGEDIKFQVKIANLQAGSFTNPDVTYYAAPQALQGGTIVGHTHITVQDMNGNKNPTNALDAQTFAFFKGINDNGDGNGLLTADLAKGLPNGVYRVCSMTSSSNHQPVLMPVAQRGAQDDCVRFTVGAGTGNNGGNNAGNNGQNAGNNGQQGQNNGQQGQGQQGQGQQGQGQQAQGQQGQGQQAQGQQGQGQQGQGAARGRGRGRFNRPKFAARNFMA